MSQPDEARLEDRTEAELKAMDAISKAGATVGTPVLRESGWTLPIVTADGIEIKITGAESREAGLIAAAAAVTPAP